MVMVIGVIGDGDIIGGGGYGIDGDTNTKLWWWRWLVMVELILLVVYGDDNHGDSNRDT